MPAIITKGAFSAQGYGFGASAATGATYIEDVFSTYLYTGTGASQTITNNIALSTNGGMVWIKDRTNAYNNNLFDTARGATYWLHSNTTDISTADANSLTAFGSTGFTLGSGNTAGSQVNTSTDNFVSWTFRKQPKFFDVVTYTGDGVAGRQVAHNLGSVPGMIIVKRTDTTGSWSVYHRGLTNASYVLFLNYTDAQASAANVWNSTAPTSTVFSVGTNSLTNLSGATYVAYLFAHDAGGFGAAGTDNVISCGSYTGNGSATGPTVTLGYEPQYVMVKCASTTGNWVVLDVMRGMSQTASNELFPNLSNAETALNPSVIPTATGFTLGTTNADLNTNGATYIYMAIRRGPMKTPTDATKVFSPITSSAAQSTQQTTGFPIDLQIETNTGISAAKFFVDRLRGVQTVVTTTGTSRFLASNNTDAEANASLANNWNNTGFAIPAQFTSTASIYWSFARAPGFFDEVCYTGTATEPRQITHNLGVAPQLMIVKSRSSGNVDFGAWYVYSQPTGNGYYLKLNTTDARAAQSIWYATTPTSTYFTVDNNLVNQNGFTYVAYLFATLAGVSKVGSYTGTGAAQNIDCGFAASARFILIKRTDSTGDWYVYDSARGISASNDPYLLLNTIGVQVTNTDYVGTYASGFALTSTAPAALNASGGSFIFLAVA